MNISLHFHSSVGKTSLIRYLSKSDKLASSPEVFATLDITHHRSRLPILPNKVEENNMTSDQLFSENGSDGGCSNSIGLPGIQMLLLDTIGFMSDLPTNLLAAFRATLDECLDAVSLLRVCISFITQSHVIKLRISLLFSFEGVFTTIMVFIYQL